MAAQVGAAGLRITPMSGLARQIADFCRYLDTERNVSSHTLAACESETTTTAACTTPAATYKIEWKAESGNCPAETVKALIEGAAQTSPKVS